MWNDPKLSGQRLSFTYEHWLRAFWDQFPQFPPWTGLLGIHLLNLTGSSSESGLVSRQSGPVWFEKNGGIRCCFCSWLPSCVRARYCCWIRVCFALRLFWRQAVTLFLFKRCFYTTQMLKNVAAACYTWGERSVKSGPLTPCYCKKIQNQATSEVIF